MAAPMESVAPVNLEEKDELLQMEANDTPPFKNICKATNLLNNILLKLVADNIPNDDTFLQKLGTYIEEKVTSEELCNQFTQETCILDCILKCPKVCKTPQSFGFFLSMGGWLGHLHTDLISSHLTGLFKEIPQLSYWEEPSVRFGWLIGTKRVAQEKAGLYWIWDKDAVTTVVSCLADSSLYVTRAACDTVATLIVGHAGLMCEKSQYQPQNDELLSAVLGPLATPVNEVNLQLSLENSLCIVSKMCKSKATLLFLAEKHSLQEKIASLLKTSRSAREIQEALSILSSICEEVPGIQQLGSLPTDLMQSGDLSVAIQVASTLLIKLKDCDQAEEYLKVLLSPLLACCDPSDPPLDAKMLEMVREACTSKSVYTKMCLQSLGQFCAFIKMNTAGWDLLGEFVTYILYFSEISLGGDVSNACHSGSDVSDIRSHVIGNTRLQMAAFDVFSLLFCADQEKIQPMQLKKVAYNVVKMCLQSLQTGYTSQNAISKTYKALLSAVRVCVKNLKELAHALSDEGAQLESDLQKLDILLKKRLCDVHWETRDSTIELIGQLSRSDHPIVESFLVECQYPRTVWQSVDDGESYVRASALATIGLMAESEAIWENITVQIKEDSLIDRIGRVLQEDPDAFARRSAVDLVTTLAGLERVPSRSSQLYGLMDTAVQDPDWEVKVKVISFWEKHIQSFYPQILAEELINDESGSHSTQSTDTFVQDINSLCSTGGSNVLILAARDHDKFVQKKSCQLLSKIKQSVNFNNSVNIDIANSSSGYSSVAVKFISEILSMDIDNLLEDIERSMDDHKNPEAFLTDVLASMKPANVGIPLIEDDGTTPSIDCY